MAKGYRIIDGLTSDVMFEAEGKNLKELFENAATALLSIICKIEQVKPKKKERFEIKADRLEDLMMNWLQGLIAIIDTEQMFFSKVEIEEISEKRLRAKCFGEPMRPELGETVVKAVTYHKFLVEKTDKGYMCRVVVDI